MRTSRHTLMLAGALALASSSVAQNDVIIEGHVTPCFGIVHDVHVQTGSTPVLDTIVQTGADCSYFLIYHTTDLSGLISVSTSCDSGMTYITDSTFFINIGGDTVVMDMVCGAPIYDCNGVANGPAMPGTACDDGDSTTWNDSWTANCVCVGGIYDCAGFFNGTNIPGTACMGMNQDSTWYFGTWSLQCACVPDSNYTDCAGVPNGPALPGTPCDDGNALTHNDQWNTSCVCAGNFNAPCQALFTIVQALGLDSLPVPNNLWLYNESNGGNGPLTYSWNFGDGATSAESQPVHSYAGNGPYWLCVTVDDGMGCTDSYCDSVSVDDNGIYSGVMGGNGSRTSGFVVNVVEEATLGIAEPVRNTGFTTWPNPANEVLNVAFVNGTAGVAEITVLDMRGSIVASQSTGLAKGKVQLHLPTADLNEGMYLLRIGTTSGVVSQRFVKAR